MRKGLCLAVISSLVAAASLPAAEKVNVLLIVSDDLRDTVGCYGNAAVKTPNIDRLGARGVRFERAYVQYPVCNPSRTSFLTGLRAEQTKVVSNNTPFRSLLPDVVTLPQCLRRQGWYAAGYGKVFHLRGPGPEQQALSQDMPKSWDEAAAFKATPAGRVIEGRNLTGGKLEWCHWGMTAGGDEDQPDGQTASHAISTIERCSSQGKPWIVAAGFHRPHDPFISPKKYFDLYPPGSLKLYHDPTNITALKPLSIQGQGFREAFNAFTDVERMEFLRAYYAGVSFMDAQVGRLLDALDRLKAWDHTLVIFCGDNGYHHNERNWWNKNTLFERSCRVPLIVAAPGAGRGKICRSLVEMVDLYPTVMDFCGLPAPHVLAGQSLRPLLADSSRKGREAAFTLVSRGGFQYGQAVRTERWRYIQWSDGANELYDEAVDPQDTHDVSGEPRHFALIKELQGLLKSKVGPFQAAGTSRPQKAKRARKSVSTSPLTVH